MPESWKPGPAGLRAKGEQVPWVCRRCGPRDAGSSGLLAWGPRGPAGPQGEPGLPPAVSSNTGASLSKHRGVVSPAVSGEYHLNQLDCGSFTVIKEAYEWSPSPKERPRQEVHRLDR